MGRRCCRRRSLLLLLLELRLGLGSGMGGSHLSLRLGHQVMLLLLLGGQATFLDLLEVAAQRIAAWCLDNRAVLTGQLRFVVVVVGARVAIVLALLLLLALLAAIDVVLQLDAHLAICGLVLDEAVLQQVLGVRPLVIVLNCW